MSRLILVLLGALAAHHLAKGVYYLAIEEPPTAIADYQWRQIDNAYFLDRIPPQSENFAHLSAGDPTLRPLAAGADWSERHGADVFSGLPPWTYAMELAIYLPIADRLARLYLAALDIAALALMAWVAYDEARRHQLAASARVVAVLAVLAIGATNEAMSDGQTSLVINAGLAAAFLALRRTPNRVWDVIGGAGLGLSLIKPTLGVLFLLPVIAQRRFVMLATCAAIVSTAWLASAWWVHLSPWFQLVQFEHATRLVVARGANIWLITLAGVLSPEWARNLLGVAGLAAAAWGVSQLNGNLPAVFAWLAVISRMYTYHGSYDDVVLAFLVICLSTQAWTAARVRSSRTMMIWLCAGVSLWLPYSLYVAPAVRWAQSLCWLAALYELRQLPDPATTPSFTASA